MKYILIVVILCGISLAQEINPLIPQIQATKTSRQVKTSLYLTHLINYIESEKTGIQSSGWINLSKNLNKSLYDIDHKNRIHIRIKCTSGYNQVLAYLQKENIPITGKLDNLKIIDCRATNEQINKITEFDQVRNISLVERGFTRTGSVTSEGDTLHNTDIVRQYIGTDGSGIRVGVISDGVDNLADAQLTDDLPSTITVLDNSADGDEGTAMLEIVHDLAPGAELYFSQGVSSSTAFINSVNNLVAAGCDVVVDDIGYFGEAWFEEGPIATAVKNAIQNEGIVYASSAGNSQNEHYEDDFVSAGSQLGLNDVHDFGGGDWAQEIRLNAAQTFVIYLQWNDPFGSSTNDYTLHLANRQLTALYDVEADQPDLDNPYVLIVAQSTGSLTFNVLIERKAGAANRRVELEYLFFNSATINEFYNSPGSVNGQPVVSEVIATGAVRYDSPNVIEYFSSIGPSRIYSYPAYTYEERSKPDLVAVDGNIITGAGGFGYEYPSGSGDIRFFGTSAAAPHAAACAAVLWSAYPNLTNSGVKQRLLNTAIDLGSTGFDYTYGHGRIDVQPASASPQFTITGINGGSDAMISSGITPGDNLAEVAGYTFTADQSPFQAYLDSIIIDLSGSADADDLNGFELYADLDQNGIISPVTDSLLASLPFSQTLIFPNISYGFDNTGVDLIVTANVKPSANQSHVLNLELQDPLDVVAYFDVNPVSANFPFQVFDISLPVQLTAFDVLSYHDHVVLDWQTASEVYAAYYEINKSTSSGETILTRIEASGNSSKARIYTAEDRDVSTGQNIEYSLYLVENDGRREQLTRQKTIIPYPQEFTLSNNYPNPFNPQTTISFTLPQQSLISLSIYDITGKLVDSFTLEELPPGKHNIVYSASGLPSGIYFYRLTANLKGGQELSQIKRMVLLK